VTALALSPSYWLVSVPDLLTDGAEFARDERATLKHDIINGMPRYLLRGHFGLLPWLYLLVGAPLALAWWGLSASGIGGVIAELAFGVLLVFSLVAAVWYGVRWVVCSDDDAVVRWHPLASDAVLLVVAVLLVALR
jgi:hypothetical protein